MRVLGILVALAQGVAVGAAAMLVFSVLGLVSQCAAVTGTGRSVSLYGWAVCLGAAVLPALHVLPVRGLFGAAVGKALLLPAGLLCGMFVGMLLTALTEVLDIFPAISGKLKLNGRVKTMVFALAAGKTAGVLLYYLTPWFIGL